MLKYYTLTLLSCLMLSCQDDTSTISISKSKINILTQAVLQSSELKKLDIVKNTLDTDNARFINSTETSLAIPYKNMEETKGLIVIFENNSIKTIVEIELKKKLSNSDFQADFSNKNFSGLINFRDASGQVSLNFENSKITDSSILLTDMSGKIAPSCNDITKTGGSYDCAGLRIQQMNWFEKTLCYASFLYCFGQEVISCVIDNCVVNPN